MVCPGELVPNYHQVWSYSALTEVFHFTNDTVHGQRAGGDRFLLTVAGCTSL